MHVCTLYTHIKSRIYNNLYLSTELCEKRRSCIIVPKIDFLLQCPLPGIFMLSYIQVCLSSCNFPFSNTVRLCIFLSKIKRKLIVNTRPDSWQRKSYFHKIKFFFSVFQFDVSDSIIRSGVFEITRTFWN